MTTLLLDRGADINLVSRSPVPTALGTAAYWGKLEMATLLLNRGANPDLTNQKPHDLAERRGRHLIVGLLDSYSQRKSENQANHGQTPGEGSADGQPCTEEPGSR